MHEITSVDENGVIIEKKSVPEGGKLIQKIRTPKQEEYNNTHINKFNQGVRWGKIYVDMMPYVEKELSSTDWMFFCRLISKRAYCIATLISVVICCQVLIKLLNT